MGRGRRPRGYKHAGEGGFTLNVAGITRLLVTHGFSLVQHKGKWLYRENNTSNCIHILPNGSLVLRINHDSNSPIAVDKFGKARIIHPQLAELLTKHHSTIVEKLRKPR